MAAAPAREALLAIARNGGDVAEGALHTVLEDWPLALRAADRCVDLLPEHPVERRDRGLLLWRLGRSGEALADIRYYLDATPAQAGDRAGLEEVAGRLHAFMN